MKLQKWINFGWTNDIIIEFMQLYEGHPVLWDPKHRVHKNRNNLNDAWVKIARDISVEVTVDALKKKKESLMSTYTTLSKKVRDSETTGSGSKDVYEPTWFAFHAIDRFIRASTKKLPSLCSEESHNYNEPFYQDDISNCELTVLAVLQNDGEIAVDIKDDPLIQEISQDREFVTPQSAPKKRTRAGLSQMESNVAKHLKNASDVLTSIATKSQTCHAETHQDASALYGQLLAAKLRRLPERTQLVLQNKIDNLVFQAELNEIDSVPGSSTSCSPNSASSSRSIHSIFSPISPHPVISPVSHHPVVTPVPNQVGDGPLLTFYTTANNVLDLTNE